MKASRKSNRRRDRPITVSLQPPWRLLLGRRRISRRRYAPVHDLAYSTLNRPLAPHAKRCCASNRSVLAISDHSLLICEPSLAPSSYELSAFKSILYLTPSCDVEGALDGQKWLRQNFDALHHLCQLHRYAPVHYILFSCSAASRAQLAARMQKNAIYILITSLADRLAPFLPCLSF